MIQLVYFILNTKLTPSEFVYKPELLVFLFGSETILLGLLKIHKDLLVLVVAVVVVVVAVVAVESNRQVTSLNIVVVILFVCHI